MSLAERLGYSPDQRLLIISCDNLGCFHAANIATYAALREGVATNAALMVPAPWAREAVRGYRGADVGVNLTLNAEFECYRWGSISHAPTLHSGEGGFPRSVADLWEHADADEVRRECRAQIERAIVWGFDPTHLTSHLGAMVLRPELFDVYIDLAVEFKLPVRLADADSERNVGFPLRQLAADEQVLSPDRTVHLRNLDVEATIGDIIADLPQGVTEIVVQPAIDSPELRALTPDADRLVSNYEQLISAGVAAAITQAGVIPISYAALRDAQRL